ncbi:MAG TPA: hypothetical protein GXZ56_05850 [Bacteroidales bacterium]|nr:hypothetical protein [Bacteroidales bacterium]
MEKMHIINQTQYGIVFKCSVCNKIHIEFNNFNLNLSESEYNRFVEYIHELDGDYWEESNKKSMYRRKIRIPIAPTRTCLMLHADELPALRQLLVLPGLDSRVKVLITERPLWQLLVLPGCVVEKMLVEKLQASVCWS